MVGVSERHSTRNTPPRCQSVTDLPLPVLAMVCLALSTTDLLAVCLASRMLYLQAVVQLYKKIIVTESKLLQKLAVAQLAGAWTNMGTLVHTADLPKLVRTVSGSAKLAALVRLLVLVDDTAISDTNAEAASARLQPPDSQSPAKSELDNALLGHIHSIVSRARLNELCCLLNGSKMALGLPAVSVLRLAVSVETFEDDPSLALRFPSLAHLKLYYKRDSRRLLEGTSVFARLLCGAGNDRTLATLEFEEMHQLSLDSLNRGNLLSREHKQSIWPHFFEVVREQHKRLALRRLGLDGFIGASGSILAQLLHETTDLACLEALQLNVKETSHVNHAHIDCGATLLETLTALTPHLNKLATHPTYDCLFCQHSALVTTLTKNVPHQLTTLSAVVESPTSAYTQAVYDCIATTQKRLMNVKLFDRSSKVADSSAMLQHLSCEDYSWYTRALYYELVLRHTVYKNYFLYDIESISSAICPSACNYDLYAVRSNSVVLNGTMAEFVRKNHLRLARFVRDYFAVEPHCVSPRPLLLLPNLQYLSVLGLSIYINRDAAPRAQFMLNSGDQFIDLDLW